MIRLWDLTSGTVLTEFLQDHGGAGCVALSLDGRRLAAGSADGRVRFWEAETGRPNGEIQAHPGGVMCLAFGMDGQVLATGGRDGAVILWDLARLKELKRFGSHSGPVTTIVFSNRGDILLTGGEDTVIRVRETVSGQDRERLRGHAGAVTALTFSPDGQMAASGGWDRSARIWDMETGQSRNLAGLGGGVRAVAFTPDGRELITGGGKIIRTWEPASGRALRQFAPLTSAVLSSALTPDGATLAIGMADGLIRLLDVGSSAERGHLEGHRGPVVALACGGQGRLLASASSGASIATRGPVSGRQPAIAPLLHESTEAAKPLDLDQLWNDMAGGPRQALSALRVLGADPIAAVALVRDRLRPADADSPSQNSGIDPSADSLRGLRSVDLLTRIASPEARSVLEVLANGAPDAALTGAAKSALARFTGG